MATASLLALLDDIATVLDDVATMTKVAAKKTAGVLGDDLAVNAEQVSGIKADRELPVVWAVAKGSFLNKLILVPAALAISVVAPWLITPLLMLGGAFLCYEGFEKVLHAFFPEKHAQQDHAEHQARLAALNDPDSDMVEFEKNKIKGAIRTDFILSAEIIVITLGTVKSQPFAIQASVVATIALLMTIGVYGLVAGIVKMDDAGLLLIKEKASHAWGKFKRALGRGLLWFSPRFMKALTIVGTAAMFLVGGSILIHGIPSSHDWIHAIEVGAASTPVIGNVLKWIAPLLADFFVGLVAGAIVVFLMKMIRPLIPSSKMRPGEGK